MPTDDDSHSPGQWLLYGAYGYTGKLVARRAVAAGMQPILAGRDAAKLEPLAEELGCSWRAVSLDDAGELRAALDGVDAVAHCAGPFAHTSAPMVEACLAAGVHYLDITGEVAVLERVLGQDEAACEAGVVLLPGAGFDVVPTDCLAAMVAADVGGQVEEIELAFLSRGGTSSGTARTAVEGMHERPLRRRDGELVPVGSDERRREITYVSRTAGSTAISWGDLATAPRSTGASSVIVHMALPTSADAAQRVAGAALRVPGARRVLRPLLARATDRISGPDLHELAAPVGCELWARATAADGTVAERRMVTPNGYALTADSLVRIVAAALDGRIAPGAHTPSTALGADFVLELDGVQLREAAS